MPDWTEESPDQPDQKLWRPLMSQEIENEVNEMWAEDEEEEEKEEDDSEAEENYEEEKS